MAKKYTNKNSGSIIVSGVIKEFSEDGLVMTLATSEYNTKERKNMETEVKVTNPIGFSKETYKPGYHVTAVGYPHGKGTIQAERIMSGNDFFENQDLTVITGYVRSARLNEEKDAEGNPRLNQKGEPRKPHFDITVAVKDGDRWVNHVVKIYDIKGDQSKTSRIDRAKAQFREFDRDSKPAIVTIVTGAGNVYQTETERDGRVFQNFYCNHMGAYSIDMEYTTPREQTRNNPTQGQTQASPAPAAAKEPATSGFDAPLEMEEDEFH